MLITRSRIAFSLVAIALVACSSAPPDTTLQGEINPGNSNKGGSKTPAANKGSSTNNGGTSTTQDPTDPADPAADPATPAAPATPGTPGTPAPGTGQCAASAGAEQCFQCCDAAFPGGLDVDAQAYGQCVCEAPGVCAQQCATSYCAGQQPTAACEQCLNAATQCEQAAETACNANANCKGAFTCIESSGCEQKQ